MNRISSSASLSSQQHFVLKWATARSGEELLALLRCFRLTLRTLGLYAIFSGSDTNWRSILEILSAEFPCLESITLVWLWDAIGDTMYRRRLTFHSLGNNSFVNGSPGRSFEYYSFPTPQREGVYRVHYTGPDMDLALMTLASSIEFPDG